jgi:hypothetical protein
MAAYVCRICGEKADSKCVGQRNVFQEDQLEALLSHSLKFRVIREKVELINGGSATKTNVELTYLTGFDSGNDKVASERDSLLAMFKMIRGLSQETIDHYSCMHSWQLVSDECDLGCCKRRE